MRRILFILFILPSIFILGCSVSRVATQGHLKSITREETKPKGMFGGANIITINDFRKVEKYDEDIEALKEKAENYIAARPDLSESSKNNLRELSVLPGSTKDEVKLLLGEPDKIISPATGNQTASEAWVYSIKKLDVFTVFIIPVFFTHQSYYLYFNGDTLANIEKHYLEQLLESTSPPDQSELNK